MRRCAFGGTPNDAETLSLARAGNETNPAQVCNGAFAAGGELIFKPTLAHALNGSPLGVTLSARQGIAGGGCHVLPAGHSTPEAFFESTNTG